MMGPVQGAGWVGLGQAREGLVAGEAGGVSRARGSLEEEAEGEGGWWEEEQLWQGLAA